MSVVIQSSIPLSLFSLLTVSFNLYLGGFTALFGVKLKLSYYRIVGCLSTRTAKQYLLQAHTRARLCLFNTPCGLYSNCERVKKKLSVVINLNKATTLKISHDYL